MNFEARAQADPGDYPLYFNLATIWSELGNTMMPGQQGNEVKANRYLARAKELAEKLLALGPENVMAKEILQWISSLIATP